MFHISISRFWTGEKKDYNWHYLSQLKKRITQAYKELHGREIWVNSGLPQRKEESYFGGSRQGGVTEYETSKLIRNELDKLWIEYRYPHLLGVVDLHFLLLELIWMHHNSSSLLQP